MQAPATRFEPTRTGGARFYFAGEGHTLGNPLREQLMRDPRVAKAGYRDPEEGDAHLEFDVVTRPNTVAPQVALAEALAHLQALALHCRDQFRAALDKPHAH